MIYVSRVEIENIKGIARCELKLAGNVLTIIKGANASGKTSILDAIASVFQGGSDPTLVRQGAKTGKVIIELSNSVVIKKAQSDKGTQLSVTAADGEQVKSPQTYIDSLATSFAFDPLEFCRAPKAKRAEFLLKKMPLEFTGKELHALKVGKLDAAGPIRAQVGIDVTFTLAQFDELRKRVYEKRRTANVETKQLDGSVAQLRKSIPEGGEDGSAGIEQALQNHQNSLAKIDGDEHKELSLIAQQVATARDEVANTYEAAVEEARKARDASFSDIVEGEREAVNNVRNERKDEREKLLQAIGEAQANLKRVGEIAALTKHLDEQQELLKQKSTEADDLDRALTALDELKQARVSTLPVAGLEIRDGEVYRDNVPFDQLNQARQYFTAVEIGCLGIGELPLIIGDEFEHLDAQQKKEFAAALEGSGLQMIVAQVDDGDLRSEPQGALKL